MANRPISANLPADLPEDWQANQIVSPSGTGAGLDAKHGYNYQSKQINDAQKAINTMNQAFDGLTPKPESGQFPPISHAATHRTGGSDPLAPVDIGAATAPTSVTVTLPVSGWTLNSSTTCYEQTVPVTGLLASDSTKTVTVWPHGSTDAAAQLLTDAAYAAIFTQGGYSACNTDGHLYCRGPAGGSKPQVDFPVDVVFHR